MVAIGGAVLSSLIVDGIESALGKSQGGLVKADGLHMLHKGEIIIPAKESGKILKAWKKSKGLSASDLKKLKLRHAKPHEGKRPV
tara:strand:- start:1964 stop:2218 length:255 start_codon:yes stop_codon:yes gene_type:complete